MIDINLNNVRPLRVELNKQLSNLAWGGTPTLEISDARLVMHLTSDSAQEAFRLAGQFVIRVQANPATIISVVANTKIDEDTNKVVYDDTGFRTELVRIDIS